MSLKDLLAKPQDDDIALFLLGVSLGLWTCDNQMEDFRVNKWVFYTNNTTLDMLCSIMKNLENNKLVIYDDDRSTYCWNKLPIYDPTRV